MSRENEAILWAAAIMSFVMFVIGAPWPLYVGSGIMTVGVGRILRIVYGDL